ncbi:hypothetical protein [Streptomyces sp. WAC 06738]|uniref:hypothetical protein n=1 Tax=Streptomyces sp. WAC 06738 TaxID=2203210 RepID=UPI000F787E43|nr:hypothetical protein [Streptomyces sp. WAC 06738]
MVAIVQPGQTLTADRLNSGFLVGMLLFRATRDTNQAIATGNNPIVGNAISWETVELDDLGGWAVANPTRYTCRRAGWYELTGEVSLEASTGGSVRGAAWYLNGSLVQAGHGNRITATPTNLVTVVSARTLNLMLAVGDYVELVAVQNSGAALNTGTGGGRPSMNVTYKRPV